NAPMDRRRRVACTFRMGEGRIASVVARGTPAIRLAFPQGREAMNVFSYMEAALLRLEQLAAWLISDILTFPNLIQIPAVALTGAVAWLVSRPIDKWAHAWVARSHATSYSDWVNRH